MNALKESLMHLGGFSAFSCRKASCGGTHRIIYEYATEWKCSSLYDDEILVLHKIPLYSTVQPNPTASTLLPIQPNLHTKGITPVRRGSTLHLFLGMIYHFISFLHWSLFHSPKTRWIDPTVLQIREPWFCRRQMHLAIHVQSLPQLFIWISDPASWREPSASREDIPCNLKLCRKC